MKTCLLFFSLLITTTFHAQDANTYGSDVPNHYFDFSLKLVTETPGFTPPVAARAFGFMGLALYEGVVPGIPSHVSTQGVMYELTDVTLPDPGVEYHWPTVANNALGIITDSLFRTATQVNKDSLRAIKDYYNAQFEYQLSPQVFNDSKAFGEAIAADIFDYSRTDGGHNSFAMNFPMDYVPPVGPSYWVPFGMQTCMQPYWGSHRPFIQADTTDEVISPTPPEFSTEPGSEFYNNAYEVYETDLNLTPEEMTIALFWADGVGTFTPPGHSIAMLKNILAEGNYNLEVATLAYAKLGIAVSDAFLACWKTKYIYNLCRPVTFIRQYIDTSWVPLIATPPFPEYPSGHSSQSGAMASVMSDIFGSSFAFTDSAHGDEFGGPRSFESFDEAALEAATSRLYGGIHYPFGNQAGLDLGYLVGENVNELFEQVNVGVAELSDPLAMLSVYPNPAHDIVSITSPRELNGINYQIYDIHGKSVSDGHLNDGNTEVDIKALQPGVYVLRAGENSFYSYKLIKN